MLPLKQFQCWSDRRWPFLASSQRRAVERFPLSTTPLSSLLSPGDRWCDGLGSVPAGSVYASLLQAIDGVMVLALCPQVVSTPLSSLQAIEGVVSLALCLGAGSSVSSSSTLQVYIWYLGSFPCNSN